MTRSYALIVICVECQAVHHGVSQEGVRMRAVSGSYAGPAGFIFECPQCKRRVGLAHVEPRIAENVKILAKVPRRGRGVGNR